MSIEPSEWIWCKWRVAEVEQATVHVTAHALHYGSSAFEGIRAYDSDGGPAIFRLRDHLVRLLGSAKILRMDTRDFPLERLSGSALSWCRATATGLLHTPDRFPATREVWVSTRRAVRSIW